VPTRRTVLTAAAMAGALAACTPEDRADPAPVTDPNTLLVLEALGAEEELEAKIRKVSRRYPHRGTALAPTRAVHVAHLELLTKQLPEGTQWGELRMGAGPAFKGDDLAAYLAVARGEDRLGQTLRRLAFEAESGPLARVFAGMAAATAQQSAVLRRLL